MSTPPANPKRRRALPFALGLVAALSALVYWRGHVGCYLFYAECNPLLSMPEMPDWNVPTNPHEKAMYDLAHSLEVPDSVVKPVPFDFKAARLRDLYGDRSVEQQYFEHLCATESRDYVFRRIPDVEGFQIMRPRPETMETPEDYDRYGVEEPVGFGWQSDANQLDDGGKYRIDVLADAYVQPLYGVYRWLEIVQSTPPHQVVRVERALTERSKRSHSGIEANWRSATSGALRVPYLQSRRVVAELSSRYGYVWRGLRRERDRELAVGGGDFFVIDLTTHEVLGLRRTFNSTFVPKRPSFTKWSAARECGGLDKSTPVPRFIAKVLNPTLQVNDEFVPVSNQAEYHAFLKRLMEIDDARN